MVRLRIIGKQALILFIGRVTTQLTNFLTIILLARYLGPETYGIFSLSVTLMVMLYTIFNFGIDSTIKYFVPHYQSKDDKIMVRKITNSILLLITLVGISGSLILYYMSGAFEDIYEVKGLGNACKILSFGFLGYVLVYLSPSVFQAYKKFKISSTINIIFSSIKFILILAVLVYGLEPILKSYVSALIITSIIILWKLRKIISKTKEKGFAFGTIIQYSLISYIGSLSLFIINNFGNLLVGFIPSEVSYLTISNKVGMLLMLPVSVIDAALFPNLSGLLNKEKISDIYKKITRYVILISFFVSAYVITCNKELINLTISSQYASASPLITMMTIGFLCLSFIAPVQTLYASVKKPHKVTLSLIIQAGINLLLSLLLVHSLMASGIAIAFMISSLVTTIYLLISVSKDGYGYPFKQLLKLVITTAISMLTFLFNGLIIKSIVYVLFFAGSSLFLKSIKINEIKTLKIIKD